MAYIEDGLMETGGWELELDYDPAIATWDADDWLDPSPEGRPLTHLEVYEGERLVAPPLPLLRRRGDDKGFVIGGPGIEWYQGADVAPLIEFAEFISGNNRLRNFDFAREFADWSRADGSYWIMDSGAARINGNNQVDDALIHEPTFDVRQGQEWKATAAISRLGGGAGRMRVRIIFTGRFSHPNLLPEGNFEDPDDWTTGPYMEVEEGGQRSGTKALRIGIIPKPQLATNPRFAAGSAGWTLPSEMTVMTDPVAGVPALACLPIPYPQLLANPGLENTPLGSTWSVATIPGDISIEASAEAKSGSNVMRVGPITQHQELINADFGAGLTNWYSSSSDADPHAVWSVDVGTGVNGTDCVRTTGWSTAGRPGPETIKYLRADSIAGGGVDTYGVEPGEQYRIEAYFRAAPGTEGQAVLSIMIPHPSVPGHDIWHHSFQRLEGVDMDDMRWVIATIESLIIPANRNVINVLAEIRNHGLGYWYLDHYTVTRIRGNRARIWSLPCVVEPNSQYRFRCSARSDADHQVGSVKIGGVLLGATDPEDVSRTQGNTDLTWARVALEFTPTEDQGAFQPYVEGEDLLGRFWLDEFALEKISNNSRQATHVPFALTEGQRYTLASTVRPDATISRGSCTTGVVLSGAGLPDMEIPLTFGFSDTGEPMAQTADFTPEPGYTAGATFVRHTDVEGGIFYVHSVEVIKADNNRDSTDGPTFSLTPERTYQLIAHARSDAAMTGGYAYVSLTYSAAGRPDVGEDSPPMELTDDGDGGGPKWKMSPWDFAPPSGYGSATVKIVGVDVDGGPLWLDDITVIDADPTTTVTDTQSAVSFVGLLEVTATVPAGAERVHTAAVVEKEGYGWRVHEMSLAREVDTPATGEDVIRALLLDPDTGAELAVLAGDIDAPDVISADWEVRNLGLRAAARQFASSVASPVLEWWTDAERRQHWGPAETLFTDHAPGTEEEVLFLEGDLPVEGLPPRDEDATNRASKVKLIGAERPTATGTPTNITAVATDTSGTRDYDGRPLNRSLLVEDSTNDHQGLAEAAAATSLANNAQPVRTFDVPLSDTRTYPPMKPGDWVYAHKASAGIVGAYPAETHQGTVYAERFRILGRRLEGLKGLRFVLRKGPGAEMELTGVRTGPNRTTLTLGERRPPDITTDAAGRPLADSVLRYRASSPR